MYRRVVTSGRKALSLVVSGKDSRPLPLPGHGNYDHLQFTMVVTLNFLAATSIMTTMSYRTDGRTLNVDPKAQHVDDAETMKFFKREEIRKPWVIEEEV